MRILVALTPYEVSSPSSGGAVSTVAEGLGRAWASQGHQVCVTTPAASALHRTVEPFVIDYPRRRGGAWVRRAEAKLENRWREFDWPAYRLFVKEIARAIRIVEPDCLIIHNDLVLPTLRLPLPASRFIVHLHNQVHVNRPERARTALQRAHHAVAVSDFIAADARSRLGATKVTTIHNGVDFAAFQRRRTVRAASSPLRVAFLGRLLQAKGPHVLLEAVRQLSESNISIALTVIGSPTFDPADDHTADPYLAQVLQGVERIGGRYLPHLDRNAVAEELPRQDVVVVPSLFPDPFPLVMFEAMAAGCAVVASDIGGIPEAVAGVGLLFPPGDASALSARLAELATNVSVLAECASRGQERAADHDWPLVAEEWEPILRSVCE
jgi:glycosyltransferase involved in cell wall biosynthesis